MQHSKITSSRLRGSLPGLCIGQRLSLFTDAWDAKRADLSSLRTARPAYVLIDSEPANLTGLVSMT